MDQQSFTPHTGIQFSWLIKMAWRDSRRNRSRLFLFMSSIILGIAALVSTFSFGYNLRQDIDRQGKILLGADLTVEGSKPLTKEDQSLLDTLGNRHAEERSFASMVYFVKTQATRLVQVRALQGDYPFYGSLETTPVNAAQQFRSGKQALVARTLMLQYGAKVGDSIKIGALSFAIAGILEKAPGRNEISTTVAPPVYIPLTYLEQTGLLQKGSRIGYSFYFRYADAVNMEKLAAAISPRLEQAGLNVETVESRKKQTTRAFADFSQFLTLTSFIALLLGCIGVASAIHIYIREKISSIAILRCLGVKASQTFLIFLIQITGIGLIGSVIGACAGVAIQQVLPIVFKDFLPVQSAAAVSWVAIGQGVLLGLVISLLFAFVPLLSIRNISPLYTLRLSFESGRKSRDPWKGVLYCIIVSFVVSFAAWQMHSWIKAMVFTGSMVVAFLLLASVALLLIWVTRRFIPASWSFLWRQALANLHRPNNQTLVLLITLGLGTAFISTLYNIQHLLVSSVSIAAKASEGNMILFDIQGSQLENVGKLLATNKLPVLQQVAIVTMKIERINGKPFAERMHDSAGDGRRRGFESEIRVTYRDALSSSEKITAGKLYPPIKTEGGPVYISIENDYAKRLHVKLGDTVVFNVQGRLIATLIGSLRQVEWRSVQTNFRIVFPTGVLEEAPQFHVIITHTPGPEISATFQTALVRSFPNVSVIDLSLIVAVMDDILNRISFVIRFMAAFSMITGLIVLISSVLISKYQRIQESVLLRTLGAGRKQILTIATLEYFFLGFLAALTGVLLSLAAGWALARFSFDIPFTPPIIPLIGLLFLVSLLTIIIGLLNSRDVINKPPLEILRNEQ